MTTKLNSPRIHALLTVTASSLALATLLHCSFSDPHIIGKAAAPRFALFLFWSLILFHSIIKLLRAVLIEVFDVPDGDRRLERLHLLLLPGLLWFGCVLFDRNVSAQGMGGRDLSLIFLFLPVALFLALFLLRFKDDLRRKSPSVSPRMAGKNTFPRLLILTLVVAFAIATDRVLIWTIPDHGTSNNRNVILISIDTLRPDLLGCYGAQHGLSPAIDRLAEEGVAFERAYSTAPCTLPAHMTMMTGLVPPEHGIRQSVPAAVVILDQSIPTIAEFLKQDNYLTIGFADGGYLSSSYGFDRGFDSYASLHSAHSPAGKTIDDAGSFLETLDSRREFFLFVHTFGVHNYFYDVGGLKVFTPPISEDRASALKLAYMKRISMIDSKLSRLFAIIREKGLDRNTLIIFVSDHGEGFREHGHFGHGNTLYDELLSIPMILKCPLLPADERIPSPVSLVDILPTVLHWTRGEPDGEFSGKSLIDVVDKIHAEGEDRVIFSERNGTVGYSALLVDGTYGEDREKYEKLLEDYNEIPYAGYSIVSGKYKYITYPEKNHELLFDTAADPREINNLARKDKHLLEQKRMLAEEFVGNLTMGEGKLGDLSKDLESQLKALGYIQ